MAGLSDNNEFSDVLEAEQADDSVYEDGSTIKSTLIDGVEAAIDLNDSTALTSLVAPLH